MTVVYPSSIINQRLQVVVNAIDGGAGNGFIQIGNAGFGTTFSTIQLLKPSASVSSGVLTFLGTPLSDGGAIASGIGAEGRITDSAGNVVISGLSVGTSSTFEIQVTLVTFTAGVTVTFLSGSITGH